MDKQSPPIERMTRNPTLRPAEYPPAMGLIKRKKKHVAGVLGITPETLSRIIAGKPASKPVEKMFRLLVICETMPDETPQQLLSKWQSMLQVVSLDLSPMEIVP